MFSATPNARPLKSRPGRKLRPIVEGSEVKTQIKQKRAKCAQSIKSASAEAYRSRSLEHERRRKFAKKFYQMTYMV